ncbi:DUF3800 domain-containing protein [Kribbella sp. NPDC000426]|uniref:DUF3800 domain-containing protein n=1 Tax=Kribbella sp. NPDC000426 TaxID=3154255 RepID=UPI0033192A31
MYFDRPLVRAYVDETGDRGLSSRSSRYFGMVALVLADEDDSVMRRAIGECRRRLSVPAHKPLHWTEHVKRYPRRQFVASQLAAVPGAVLNIVLVEKAAAAEAMSDQVAFYNFVAGRVLEQVLDTADQWPGGRRDVVITFGHVRGFRHEETLAWFEKLRASDSVDRPWDLLRGRPGFLGPGQLDGLQAADQYCGMLRAALEADEFGGFEAHHLLAVRPQIRYPDGFEGIVLPGTMAAYPWWPVDGL